MTTFTTEDRELAEKEPIPFYGFFCIDDSLKKDEQSLLHPITRKVITDYKIGDCSED